MPDDVPPYDAPEEPRRGPSDHPDEESRGACLIATLSHALEAWQVSHPEASVTTVVDALLSFTAGTLLHWWQEVEQAMPEPPVPWTEFMVGLEGRFAELLAHIRATCRCRACRPAPPHC